jgi:hypothetical protein
VRIETGPGVVEHIQANGGQLFVWTIDMVYGFGFEQVFTLEASTASPGAERTFVRFAAEGFDLFLDAGDRGAPNSVVLRLTGRHRKTVRAYWDGHSFARREA